jgi:hypothetical protein
MPTASHNDADPDFAAKAWVDQWQRVGPLLEDIRSAELRNLSDDESANALESLSQFVMQMPDRQPRTTSGFVTQQLLFLKLRGT